MGSVVVLMVLLGSLILYQRYLGAQPGPEAVIPAPAQDGQTYTAESGSPTDSSAESVPGTGTEVKAETAGNVAAASGVAGKANAEVAPPQHLVRPLQGTHKVLQPFGFMKSEVFGDFRLHPGIDYEAGLGESVMAAAAGKVVNVTTDPVEGQMLEIEHTGGMVTRYGGLGKVLVALNATVQSGAIVGQVGEPTPIMQATGTHLYFEVQVTGNPEDPRGYLER
jgi:murein DD-endopeptidase MepM/ murein hydrolase activator NlpD